MTHHQPNDQSWSVAMPRLPAAFGVILTAALCIGLAVFRYPQVNQQVWEMVQAGRQQSANGESSLLWLGLAIPDHPTLAQSQENLSEQPSTANQAITAEAATTCEAVAFVPAPIAQYVGTEHGDEQGRSDALSEANPTRQEKVQITLAVPPQMAIRGQTERDSADESETVPAISELKEMESEHRDSSHETRVVSFMPSQPLSSSSVAGTEEAAKKTWESRPSRVNSDVDPAGDKTFASAGGQVSAASQGHDDFVDPPLVPIIKNEVTTSPTGSVNDTSDFEFVAPHDAVARLAPSPQVTLPSDLPLVNVYRHHWFSVERPQRLPPVEEESQEGTGSSDSQGLWDWTPSIPLYPSTGRSSSDL
jgi:hypothetical protein